MLRKYELALKKAEMNEGGLSNELKMNEFHYE